MRVIRALLKPSKPGGGGRCQGVGFTTMLAQFSPLADLGNGLTDGENRVLLETTNYATTEAPIRTALRRIAENRRS